MFCSVLNSEGQKIEISLAAYPSLCCLRPVYRHSARTFASGSVRSAFRSTSGKRVIKILPQSFVKSSKDFWICLSATI